MSGHEGRLLDLLKNYLSGRSLRVVLQGEESENYPITEGIPHGCLLGPLLWNIIFDDVLLLFSSAVAYVDDSTLSKTCTSESRTETTSQLQQEIENTNSWGKRWKIKFAADKSQTLTISRLADRNLTMTLTMNGNEITD